MASLTALFIVNDLKIWEDDQIMYGNLQYTFLKGQCQEIFDLWFFSSNSPIWAPDSRVKAFLHMASNSRSYSKSRCTGGVMTPLVRYDTAGAGGLERLWLPLM
jgi:hypothetical protein